MVTDEERRDVARRLRKLSHGYVTVGDYRNAIGMDDRPNLEYDEVTGEPVLRKIDLDDTSAEMLRLADLIEPEPERTCRMTKIGGDRVLAGWWECSECGPVYPPCKDEIAEWALRKCPHCGAKVVGE